MSTTAPALRVAINGFGRIGRYTAKLLLNRSDFNLVAINDLADPTAIAHLLKYDSVHGKFDANIRLSPHFLQVNEHEVALFLNQIQKTFLGKPSILILFLSVQDGLP